MPEGPFGVNRPLADSEPVIKFSIDLDTVEPEGGKDKRTTAINKAMIALQGEQFGTVRKDTNDAGDPVMIISVDELSIRDTERLDEILDSMEPEVYGVRFDAI